MQYSKFYDEKKPDKDDYLKKLGNKIPNTTVQFMEQGRTFNQSEISIL